MARLESLARARDWLCGHGDSKISWSSEQGMAYLRREEEEKQEKETKKEKMKHMAELWLRQEVQDLELEAVQETACASVVIVDGAALSQGFAVIRRAASLGRCSFVVPAVTVQQLDFLKRSERGAREAIRWLERELGRGNAHVRAQAEGEARKLEGAEYPRQRERAAWQRFQLLECIQYFLVSGSAVCLVTADTEVLSGEVELPQLQGDWRVEDLETFGSRGEGRSRGGRGKGKHGSPADKESSKG